MNTLILAAYCALHVMASTDIAYPVLSAQQSATASAIDETEVLMQQLADAKIFGGSVAIQKAGTIVYARGYGQAVKVGLSPQHSVLLDVLHSRTTSYPPPISHYVLSLQELSVPMKAEYIFPLGSQAKYVPGSPEQTSHLDHSALHL